MGHRKDELQNKSNKKDIDDDELLKSGKLFPGDLEIKSFDDIPEELKEE